MKKLITMFCLVGLPGCNWAINKHDQLVTLDLACQEKWANVERNSEQEL